MNNLSNKQLILEALNLIRTKGPFVESFGICYNVEYYLESKLNITNLSPESSTYRLFYREMKKACMNWPKFSGDTVFPIGGVTDYIDSQTNNTIWKEPSLSLRLELIDLMIEQIKAL